MDSQTDRLTSSYCDTSDSSCVACIWSGCKRRIPGDILDWDTTKWIWEVNKMSTKEVDRNFFLLLDVRLLLGHFVQLSIVCAFYWSYLKAI